MLEQLIKNEYPNDHIARSVIRTQFFIKLLFFPLLVLIPITFFYESYVYFGMLLSGSLIDYNRIPFLMYGGSFTLVWGFFWALMWAVCGGIIVQIIPPLTIIWLLPGILFCSGVGLFIEVLILVPRMFLGCFFDLFLFGKSNERPPVLFSRPVTLFLMVVIVSTTTASSYSWITWYQQYIVSL